MSGYSKVHGVELLPRKKLGVICLCGQWWGDLTYGITLLNWKAYPSRNTVAYGFSLQGQGTRTVPSKSRAEQGKPQPHVYKGTWQRWLLSSRSWLVRSKNVTKRTESKELDGLHKPYTTTNTMASLACAL